MFATGGRSGPPDGEDDDWLRVGRSFKSAAPKEETASSSTDERALQVYKKPRKESKSDRKKAHKSKKKSSSVSSDSDRDGSDRRRRKRLKKSKKKDVKHKKRHRSSSRSTRRRSEYSESSSSSPYGSSASESEHRVVRKRRRHDADSSALALVDSPPYGEMEVYRHHQKKPGDEKLFEFDCVGDRDNRFYGSLSKTEQPLYRLATRRSAVGGDWIVDRAKRVDDTTKKPWEQLFEARYFGSEAKKSERRQGARRLHLAYSDRRLKQIARGGDSGQKEMPFIPLGVVVEGELKEDGAGEDGGSPRDHDDEDDGFQALWNTDQQNVEHFLVAKNKQLNERVSEKPTEVDAWLDLIAFQDEMQRISVKSSRRGVDQKISSSVDAMVLEKQRAVLAKALVHNPDSKQLRRLQLNLLWSEQHASGRGMDVDTYRILVEELLEKDPTNADLWSKLILCAQQNFGSFTMTMLRDLYARVVAVLNKEFVRLMQEARSEPKMSAAPASSFIRVVGNESLLGKTDPYAGPVGDTVAALSRTLLMFHQSMVRAEISAGYQERALAQVQALIDFNAFCSRDSGSTPSNQVLLEKFGAMWTDAASHFGGDGCTVEEELFDPSSSHWDQSYTTTIHGILEKVNPSASIYSREHTLSLLAPYGIDEVVDEEALLDGEETGGAAAQEKLSLKRQWVYSNLHGQRIWVPETTETSSYERILDELRGSERFQERQQVLERKLSSKKEKRANLLAKLRDERADYQFITPAKDDFLRWLANESQAEMTQWRPLRSSNVNHAALIELQPDRAILTEEILPFVARVPSILHSELVLNLLNVVGVRLTDHSTDSSPWDQASDDFDSWPVLTRPILNALDASTDVSIALATEDRYALVMQALQHTISVERAAALDPERILFIRNVFASTVNQLKINGDDDAQRLFKMMWMEYEAEVALKSTGVEASAAKFRVFCQRLLRPQQTDGVANVDALLLSAYAGIELRHGNVQQGVRVCDKTIASLHLHDTGALASTSRSYHRLIFLRVQQTWIDSSGDDELRRLKVLYLLWQPWQPQSTDSLERMVKQYRKTPQDLLKHLQKIRDDYKDQVLETYRLELNVALQQCRQRSSKHSSSTISLGCEVHYALSNLCSALFAVHGFHPALSEYKIFMEQCRLDPTTRCHARLCWLVYFAFIQAHRLTGGFPQLAPREWRKLVGASVEAFPLDEVFLRLFIDAETSNTISQTLRKYFQSRRDSWRRCADSPEMIEWLFALLCELARAERFGQKLCFTDIDAGGNSGDAEECCVLHRWGKSRPAVERIRRVFEEMVGQVNTSGNAVAWRLFVRFEVAVGRVEAARKVFYRGLVKCPWSKALYLDGFSVLRPYLTQRECQELTDFMAAKELHVRIEDQE